MSSLDGLQSTMDAMLRGHAPVDDTAAALGVDLERLGIYRDFVRAHIDGVLDKLYPMLRALVTPQRWSKWQTTYFHDERPGHWEMNRCAQTFAAWMDGQGAQECDPFYVALARYEWEEFAASLHQATVPQSAQVQRLTPNPTATILELPYRLAPFLVEHQDDTGEVRLCPETPLPERTAHPQRTILFRKSSKRVAFYHGSDDLLFALKVAHLSWSIDRAAAEVGCEIQVAQAAMDQAIAIGLVIAPSLNHRT